MSVQPHLQSVKCTQNLQYLPHNMKTSRCADTSSQLCENFIQELQLEGVTANDLASRKKPVHTMSQTSTVEELSPEFYFLQNDEGDTQLHLSIILEKFDISVFLISIAPNSSCLDIVNDECLTALHYAALTGQFRIVRKLVLAGANTQVRTRQGDTALHLAVKERHVECVKALTEPLSFAETELLAKSNIPRLMPQLPAQIEFRNYIGQTALHIAAINNDVQLVCQLLIAGADVNAKEGLSGRTALHLAIEKDNADVIHYLVQIPSTLTATMYSGEVAYQIALECRPHYIELLLRYGATPTNHRNDDDMSENGSSDGDYDYHAIADSYSNFAKFVTV